MQRTPGAGSCLCQDWRATRLATSPHMPGTPGPSGAQYLGASASAPSRQQARSGPATHRRQDHRGRPARRSGCACPARAASLPALPVLSPAAAPAGRFPVPPTGRPAYALRQPRPRLARPPAPHAGRTSSLWRPAVSSASTTGPSRDGDPYLAGRGAEPTPRRGPIRQTNSRRKLRCDKPDALDRSVHPLPCGGSSAAHKASVPGTRPVRFRPSPPPSPFHPIRRACTGRRFSISPH